MSNLGATEWTTSTPRSSSVTFVSLLDLLVAQLNKGQEMNSTVAASARWSPFTAAQWQELEHQELIFKYLTAGLPVPPELVIPIRRSFEALPTGRYFHRPPLGYCSFHGKKPDLEPGRCRRTDGKKWRCSKRAYGDSKYCERHMHRGRSRSRNTVESRTAFQTQSTSPASTLLASAGNGANGSSSQLHNMDRGSFDNRSSSEISARSRGLMPLQVSSLPTTKAVDPPTLSYAQAQDLGQVTVCSLPSRQQQQQQQRLFFGSDQFSPTEPVKHADHQTLRPFFDEWPKTRDSWSCFDGEGSNRSSFSTTQLSISTPLASSPGFSTASSRSTNEG